MSALVAACASDTVSSTPSSSSRPATVTVCAVFQFPAVKTSVPGCTRTLSKSFTPSVVVVSSPTVTVTGPPGSVSSTTV